jgi:hypothetical protein
LSTKAASSWQYQGRKKFFFASLSSFFFPQNHTQHYSTKNASQFHPPNIFFLSFNAHKR